MNMKILEKRIQNLESKFESDKFSKLSEESDILSNADAVISKLEIGLKMIKSFKRSADVKGTTEYARYQKLTALLMTVKDVIEDADEYTDKLLDDVVNYYEEHKDRDRHPRVTIA